MVNKKKHKLIITIVDKGMSDDVVEASKEAGARGGTIVHGRGTGVHENKKLFSMLIEPEKDVILTIIEEDQAEKVLRYIIDKSELNKPGNGIAFMLNVDAVSMDLA